MRSHSVMEWGVGPGGRVSHRRCCPAEISAAGHIQNDTLPGPVRFQGRAARCWIQNWPHVLSALRRAWNQHEGNRALRGLAVAPGQPVVSYIGYSLKEPWGEPRVVIGIVADEAGYLGRPASRRPRAGRRHQPRTGCRPQTRRRPARNVAASRKFT